MARMETRIAPKETRYCHRIPMSLEAETDTVGLAWGHMAAKYTTLWKDVSYSGALMQFWKVSKGSPRYATLQGKVSEASLTMASWRERKRRGCSAH